MKNLKFLLPIILLVSCGDNNSEIFINKTNYGIAPIFNDSLGINDKDPSVFKENGKEYIFYTTNEEMFVNKDCIALRIGQENSNGTMEYEKARIVLRASDNDWDSMRVSNPDVIKAFISAHAPGIGIISILFRIASFTITSPGSEIAGVPASVIRAKKRNKNYDYI